MCKPPPSSAAGAAYTLRSFAVNIPGDDPLRPVPPRSALPHTNSLSDKRRPTTHRSKRSTGPGGSGRHRSSASLSHLTDRPPPSCTGGRGRLPAVIVFPGPDRWTPLRRQPPAARRPPSRRVVKLTLTAICRRVGRPVGHGSWR